MKFNMELCSNCNFEELVAYLSYEQSEHIHPEICMLSMDEGRDKMKLHVLWPGEDDDCWRLPLMPFLENLDKARTWLVEAQFDLLEGLMGFSIEVDHFRGYEGMVAKVFYEESTGTQRLAALVTTEDGVAKMHLLLFAPGKKGEEWLYPLAGFMNGLRVAAAQLLEYKEPEKKRWWWS